MTERDPVSGSGGPDLVGHCEGFLGELKTAYSGAQPEGGHRGFDLVEYHVADPGITWVVSNGLRFQRITSVLAQELACAVWHKHARFAHFVVSSLADLALRRGRGFEWGEIATSQEPLFRGTEMYGVVATTSVINGPEFDVVWDSSGRPQVRIMTLVPITTPEIDLVEAEGDGALWEVFRKNTVDFLNLTRSSAV